MSQARLRAVRAEMKRKEAAAAAAVTRKKQKKEEKQRRKQQEEVEALQRKKRKVEEEQKAPKKPSLVMELVPVDPEPLVDGRAELAAFGKVNVLAQNEEEGQQIMSLQNEALSAALFHSEGKQVEQEEDEDDDDDEEDLFQDNWTTK